MNHFLHLPNHHFWAHAPSVWAAETCFTTTTTTTTTTTKQVIMGGLPFIYLAVLLATSLTILYFLITNLDDEAGEPCALLLFISTLRTSQPPYCTGLC